MQEPSLQIAHTKSGDVQLIMTCFTKIGFLLTAATSKNINLVCKIKILLKNYFHKQHKKRLLKITFHPSFAD